MYLPIHEALNESAKEEHVFVIVPFGCIPLAGRFRARKSWWRRHDYIALSSYAARDAYPDKMVSFEEEELVVTQKKNIASDLEKYIVETYYD